ncbi:hypothetical protein N183_19325 [Sinorhizobium sp. Sb3]|nr:hypothetical protein N183_19325 [Sinorhizobium sp. Sb3]
MHRRWLCFAKEHAGGLVEHAVLGVQREPMIMCKLDQRVGYFV